jgi:hypothetical protein
MQYASFHSFSLETFKSLKVERRRYQAIIGFEGFNNNYTLAKQDKNERQNLYKGFPIKPDAECHAAYPISQLYKSTGLSIP